MSDPTGGPDARNEPEGRRSRLFEVFLALPFQKGGQGTLWIERHDDTDETAASGRKIYTIFSSPLPFGWVKVPFKMEGLRAVACRPAPPGQACRRQPMTG